MTISPSCSAAAARRSLARFATALTPALASVVALAALAILGANGAPARAAGAVAPTTSLPSAVSPAAASPAVSSPAPTAPAASATSPTTSAAPGADATRPPLTIVVPFTAGGPTDAIAKALAPALGRALGEPVELSHIAGAGGTRGALAVAQARPDGRTLLLHHVGMATAPALYRALPYRPQQDFIPVGRVADMPMAVLVRQDFAGRDNRDTVWLLRRPQSPWLVAYAGLGAASHLCGMLLADALGVDLIQIPYQGTGPAIADLRAGRVDLMCDQTSNALAPIRAGEIRPVAVTTPKRLPSLGAVPTTAELGLDGVELSVWHALYLPIGVSRDETQRLVRALAVARRDPAFVAAMSAVDGQIPAPAASTPPALARLLAAETRRWTALIRRNGQLAD